MGKQIQNVEAFPNLRSDDAILYLFHRKCLAWLAERGSHDKNQVKIERQGVWFVIEGKVDSQDTKSKIFSYVPKINGAQWIVDRLRIT